MVSCESAKKVYVVHCVDTEGPLYESLTETFLRLEGIFGIRLTPSVENLKRIQNREIYMNGLEHEVAKVFSPKLLNYNQDWHELDMMLAKLMSSSFRLRYPDSQGKGWIYSWFCMDHLNYISNPRRKAVGIHVIFDYYQEKIKMTQFDDIIQWHFHPQSIYNEGNKCATSYVNSPELYTIICRRIIERNWFPCVNRPGFHTERPDSHWFLEQWMPFDYANQSYPTDYGSQKDLAEGRFGDWRLAPADWSLYHPDHDNYQVPGSCRRIIARCLNIGTRVRLLNQDETNKAFSRADNGQPTILAFSNHDFRDMTEDVEQVHRMLNVAKIKYPEVSFIYADALHAMREVAFSPEELLQRVPLDFHIILNNNKLIITLDSGKFFGPQPFLAIQTKDNRFIHDNLDIETFGKSWSYTFDEHTILLNAVNTIAVASNDKYGDTVIRRIDL